MRILHLKYDGFDWDSGNLKKVQKHGLSIDEIENLFLYELLVLKDEKHSLEENRTIAIGFIKKHRPLFVVFTMRRLHELNLIRVISARYMHKKEKELYEKLKKKHEEAG